MGKQFTDACTRHQALISLWLKARYFLKWNIPNAAKISGFPIPWEIEIFAMVYIYILSLDNLSPENYNATPN